MSGMSNTAVLIYGASDDLIEIEGALEEEFGTDSQVSYVYASTGDVIRFRLEDEGWRATIVHNATSPTMSKRPGHGEDDAVILAGPVAWVVATDVAPVRA